MDDALLLAGNNFAMLVAAEALARRGRRAVVFTDGKPPGGHFAGLTIEGRRFDLGMVLLERLASPTPGAPLASYDPCVRNDWTRCADRAAAWLDAAAVLRRTPTPECLVGGRRVPDYLIANRLEAFHGADVAPPAPLPRSDPRHAAHKTTGTAYVRLSYAEAACLNHGDALHAIFVEPFVRKLLGVGSDAFEARLHRAGWVPLYYPETLAAALRGEPVALAEYPFWTPDEGSVASLVQGTVVRLREAGVEFVEAPLAAIAGGAAGAAVRTADGRTWRGSRLALGLPADRAQALVGLTPAPQPAAASVAIGLFLVRAEAITAPLGCLMVVDDDHPSYRLTDQDEQAATGAAWHRVVVEANPDRLAQHAARAGTSTDDMLRAEVRALAGVEDDNSIRLLKSLTARNALVLPTAAAIAQTDTGWRALREALPGTALTGAMLPLGCASMNDQIVQGLQIAEETA
jgi:hypothetical protein